MNISQGTMDVFFYNMRVGDVNGLTESAGRYAEMAKKFRNTRRSRALC